MKEEITKINSPLTKKLYHLFDNNFIIIWAAFRRKTFLPGGIKEKFGSPRTEKANVRLCF